MSTRSLSRNSKAPISLTMLCAFLALAASAMGQSAKGESQDGHCSNRTLSGDYGFTLEGVILAPNFQIRGVVMQQYDGKGNITQVDHVVVNGVPSTEEWAPGTRHLYR